MIDFTAPSSIKAIDALRSAGTRGLLVQYAAWFSRSPQGAEDLLHEAICRVCDPEKGQPWDDAKGTFRAHMRMVVRDVWRNERKLARTRREELDPVAVHHAASTAPRPDEVVSDAEELARMRRMGGEVRGRLEGDAVALQVFDLACEGVDRPAEVAVILGCDPAAVHDANRRIVYHATRVLAEEREAEQARMAARRESAKDRKGPHR